MNFSLPCACGAEISVNSSQAGAVLECRCGRQLTVPPLSQLRVAIGKGAYEAGIIDKIKRLQNSGELPPHDFCIISGLPTRSHAQIYVDCEQSYLRRQGQFGGYLGCLLAFISSPLAIAFWLAHFFFDDSEGPVERRGHDRGVNLTVPIHDEYRGQLERSFSSTLRKLLRQTPVYDELFREYPRATLHVRRE